MSDSIQRILIAEDDKLIREALVILLEQEGFSVAAFSRGDEALQHWQAQSADLLLLDIMMPGLDGYSLCRKVRERDPQVPVMFISAKNEEIDRVLGLELGADDFLSKPFGSREVLARVRAILRRSQRPASEQETENNERSQFQIADLTVLPKELRAERNGESITLNQRDIALLTELYRHRGEVLSKDALFNAGWGRDYLPSSRTLDQHISQLRKRIERDPAKPKIIETVHGAGYRTPR